MIICPNCGETFPLIDEPIVIGDYSIGMTIVKKAGRKLNLFPSSCRMLYVLAQHRGRLIQRHIVHDALWGEGSSPKNVDVHLCYIRGELKRTKAPFKIITHGGKSGQGGETYNALEFVVKM